MDKTIATMVSQLEMVGFITKSGTACRFVSMVSDTPVVKIRKGNPYPGLRKVSKKIGIINADYCTAVEKRVAAFLGVKPSEVEYVAKAVWYEHLMDVTTGKPLPLVQHKDPAKRNGKVYLQYYPHKSRSHYVNAAGEIVADELVKPWLYAESERSEFKPAVISIDLGNVKELRASGVILQAEDYDAAAAIVSQD